MFCIIVSADSDQIGVFLQFFRIKKLIIKTHTLDARLIHLLLLSLNLLGSFAKLSASSWLKNTACNCICRSASEQSWIF